jgi:AcrR family transcriptional regulator
MRLSKTRREFVTSMMKDSIFEAAGSVLLEHGAGGLTMDRVAATAGLAKGSLYNYFEDKNELMRFFYSRLIDPFLQKIEEIAQSDVPTPRKLESILRMALDRSNKHKAIIRLLIDSNPEFYEAKIRTRPRLLEIYETIFRQGIEERSFPPHNPTHFAHMFLGCLSELFEWQKHGATSEDASAYVETLIGVSANAFSASIANDV